MTVKQYLKSLSPADRKIVKAIMVYEAAGMVHTNSGAACDPPCSGAGPTPNGTWKCVDGRCLWVPST